MKDLLVYTADADALGLIRAVLLRPEALGIPPIAFDIERHPQRDAGMVHSGAELARMKTKELFEYLMRERLRRTISPRDFEEIGRQASIKRLRECPSFDRIVGILQGWFPP